MSQHPLESSPDSRTFSPAPSDITDEDYGFPDSSSSRASSPLPDNIVRATSPLGRRYLKPINGIQTKGFASSAKRRSSVLTLGSIERLQQFYANKDLKVNKVGMLGFKRDTVSEEPDELDQLPTPQAPPPSWKDLDVETDLDVLLDLCFGDIQNMLTQWAMVTGPREHPSYSSQGSQTSNESDDGFQILPLLDSVTKMINSVKNYVYQRHDLSDNAMRQVRRATLDLLDALKVLEHRFREDTDEHGEHTYRTSDFGMLEKERQAIHEYLQIIEKCAFNPPHHIGSPPAVYSPEIKSLLAKTAVRQISKEDEKPTHGIPVWLERGSFVDDNLGRYHALLNENRPSGTDDIPDPHQEEDAFLKHLADGIVLCHAYNNIVKRSRRPFGFINKIHSDTRRTYRAIENLRFFAAACSFRFDLTFKSFDPAEIARKTDQGLNSLKQIIEAFCEGVIKELRQYADSVKARQSMLVTPNMQQDIAKYLQEKLAIDSNVQ